MGAIGNCCCDVNCVIATDNFNRTNANPPSGDWSVVSGQWEILSNRLRSISDGPIVTTIRQVASTRPNTEYSIRMYFKCINIAAGDAFAIICGYETSTTFYWVKLTELNGSMYPKFYRRSGGIDTLLMDIVSHPGGVGFPVNASGGYGNVTFTGKICFAEEDWTVDASAGSSETGIGQENSESETSWTFTGQGGLVNLPATLGMVGFLYGEFDDFAFHYHWEAKSKCDYCSCICRDPDNLDDYAQLPECLLLTFVPQFDPADYPCALNNAEIIVRQGLVVDPLGHQLSPRKFVWSSDDVGTGTPTDLAARFYCQPASFGDEKFSVCIGIPSESGNFQFADPITGLLSGFTCGKVDWTQSSCIPLNMVFADLKGDVTTCELSASPFVQGIKSPLCKDSGCIADTPANNDLIESLRWKVVVTEC